MNTTASSVSMNAHAGTVTLTGPITEEVALDVEFRLGILVTYYQHACLTLLVNSPGGQVSGLEYMLDCLKQLRKDGVQIRTQAAFEAMSAAAVLIALGDVGQRVVKRQTRLLFHHARVSNTGHAITAGHATQLAGYLNETSDKVVGLTVSHLVRSCGNARNMAELGLARCAALRAQWDTVAEQLDLHRQRRDPAWLASIEQTWRKCADKGSETPYLTLLGKRLERDELMDLREAFSLCLIDSVVGVPAMTLAKAPGCPENKVSIRLAA